ncbi:major facilitator superfamily transporter [Whalleya microplaca]|nr:major facilitator superfamily transporter [Whalleya microplaca]
MQLFVQPKNLKDFQRRSNIRVYYLASNLGFRGNCNRGAVDSRARLGTSLSEQRNPESLLGIYRAAPGYSSWRRFQNDTGNNNMPDCTRLENFFYHKDRVEPIPIAMSHERVTESTPNGRILVENVPAEPYSTFTVWQKRWIVFLIAVVGMFSPMSSFIFYPAITSIANSLDTTVGLVNLAITMYMIVSGITPAILGNAADKLGRRPIYLLALSIYLVGNIGLALQSSFAALLVLRMVQGAGSSGTISLGYGVISDITSPAERGAYVGIFCLGPNVAPPLGPVLGGAIAAQLGWKWIFWFLSILGGIVLLLVLFAMPETARSVVDNGSLYATGINRTILSFLIRRPRRGKCASRNITERRLSFPNPLACLKLLFFKDVFIVLLCNGICYATYCCIQGSLSTLFIELYGYGELQAGLIYIPFGIGCLTSTYIWGKILNYDYARTAKQFGCEENDNRAGEPNHFPIEFARLRSSFYVIGLAALSTMSYGWVVQKQVHLAVPLVLQTIIGFTITALFVALGTLLTDLNPNQSSTAAASANIVRCALAAGGLAALQPLIDAVGPGWCFTIFGLLSGLCGLLLLLEIQLGPRWRQSRLVQNQT